MNNDFYIPQQPDVKNIIHSFWQIDGMPPFHKEQIIPKGITEIIFNFSEGSPILAMFGNRQCYLPKCFMNGFNTMPVEVHLPEHQVFFGVRLQPLAVKKIIGAPASVFSDIIVDLSLLSLTFDSLWHQLAEQTNFNNRVSVFCKWVEARLFNWHPQEALMNEFLCTINQHNMSVKELADTLCYSPRHLSRKIFEVTGMNAEDILRYKKYLHAVHLIHHTDLLLTKIAYESHFADQSHFIKSFKAYAKLTPKEYNRNKGHLKGHIFENVR